MQRFMESAGIMHYKQDRSRCRKFCESNQRKRFNSTAIFFGRSVGTRKNGCERKYLRTRARTF